MTPEDEDDGRGWIVELAAQLLLSEMWEAPENLPTPIEMQVCPRETGRIR